MPLDIFQRRAVLNADERCAMHDLVRTMGTIQGWGLKANHQELTQAVHVIQGFIVQHMLERIEPQEWSNWYAGT